MDPAAVATNRTAIDITSYVAPDGPDWGNGEIEAYLGKGHVGSVPVDYDIPNRVVTIPLILKTVGATSFETIRAQLQAKVARFQAERGWISRQTSVGTMYADVVSAGLRLGGDYFQAFKSFDINAVLTLELLPDWYGAEVTLDALTETTATALVKVLKLSAADAVIAGNYPGRVRIAVTDSSAQRQGGLIWAWRSRYYSAATTAAMAYEAELFTPLDTAVSAAVSGSSGNSIRHNNLGADWTPILSTQLVSGGLHLTHVGTYRVFARVTQTIGSPTPEREIRFVWDVGDLSAPSENAPYTIPTGPGFFIADLGEVRLDPSPIGTHRWQGVVQARCATPAMDLSVDVMYFPNVDDGFGVLRASQGFDLGLVGYSARDGFNQTAGNLAGKTAEAGGVWAGTGG